MVAWGNVPLRATVRSRSFVASLASGLLTLAACGPDISPPLEQGSTGASTTTSTSTSRPPVVTTTSSTGSDTTEAPPETTGDRPDDTPAVGDTTGAPDLWCSDDWFDFECLVDPQATMISGMTPLGPAAYAFAYGGIVHCSACIPAMPWTRLIAIPQARDLPRDFFNLTDGLTLEDIEATQPGIPGSVVVTIHDGIQQATAVGELTFIQIPTAEQLAGPTSGEFVPPWTGTLTVRGDGWSLMGTFEAPACAVVMEAIPCG